MNTTIKYVLIMCMIATMKLVSQTKKNLLLKNINLINVDKGTVTNSMNIYVKDGIIKQIEKDLKKIKHLLY